MLPTLGWEPSYRNAHPLMTRYIRAPSTPITFCPLSATMTSVTESFWRSVWLLVNGDTGSREPACHSLSGRIIKIWRTSAPLRDLTAVRLVGLFSLAVLNFRSRLDPALRIWSLTLSHTSSAPQGGPLPPRVFYLSVVWLGLPSGEWNRLWEEPFFTLADQPARLRERYLFLRSFLLLFFARDTRLNWWHTRELWPLLVNVFGGPLERDIRRFVALCHVCAQTKPSNTPPAGLLRPLPIPSRSWSHIALDLVTGLPLSAGNTVILTVVNRFSKAAHFIPLPKLPSACETAQVMVDHVFKIHGLPSDIVSDRGPQFASQFWREFCRQIGASPALSSGFHPQTNGQAERTNQILGRMLRSLTSCTSASWCDQLSWADYAHNQDWSPLDQTTYCFFFHPVLCLRTTDCLVLHLH